jgi:hypothetical protein
MERMVVALMRRAELAGVAVVAVVVGLTLAGCSSSSSPESPSVNAALEVWPEQGTVITDFEFDADGSSVGSRDLKFRWDWDNDGVWDTGWSSDVTASHRFDGPDTVTVAVEAESGGVSDVARIDIPLDLDHGHLDGTVTTPVATISAVCYANGYFWASNWTGWPSQVYKLDHSTGAQLASFDGPSNWPNGIAWDGTSLWISDFSGGMRLFEIDPDDGSILSSFPIVYSYHAGGLTWDGQYFYVGSHHTGLAEAEGRDNGDGLIHKYTSSGTHVGSFACPHGSVTPCGLAFDGENLWLTVEDADSLYAVDRDNGLVLRSVPAPNGTGHLAVDDSYLWVAPWSSSLDRIVP